MTARKSDSVSFPKWIVASVFGIALTGVLGFAGTTYALKTDVAVLTQKVEDQEEEIERTLKSIDGRLLRIENALFIPRDRP